MSAITHDDHEWERSLPAVRFERAAPRAQAGDDLDSTAMADALRSAGACAQLAAAAADGRPVTVVVNDTHRPTDSQSFIEALVQLRQEVASRVEMRLLVAAGTHRSDAAERGSHEGAVLGAHKPLFTRIDWNDAYSSSGRIDVAGHAFHPWVADGSMVLACGSTEPHYFAGITGAHKTITVGVFDRETIERNHAHAMETASAGLKLDGNPVHDGIAAAVRALEARGTRAIVLNQLLVAGKAAEVFAGDPLGALDAAAPSVRARFGHTLDARVDLCVASVEAPLDRDLYQADKGIKNTEEAIRDGGVMVLEAGCAAGVGIDHFVELLDSARTHADALARIDERGYRLGDHKAVRLRALTDAKAVRLAVVSPHLDPKLEPVIGGRIFANRAAAAAWAGPLVGDSARGLLVADAGNVSLEVA